ncbi:MAG: MoxR family ATPase [Lachnospiraceae bacterium]|nr:MoxR family ATPase [Lachnospiraceae bacterium]MCR4803809.1 MoxR family ATPase [Lachnospiraceae bacterium]
MMRDRNEMLNKVMKEVGKVIVGKDEVIEKVLMALLAKGHVLMEDIPGVGKTSLALAFSKVMELDCQRVQFTPDVLPSDIVGFSILNSENEFVYKPGVVLCNLFLADEINRTSSKTQSALLEVMEEGTVTVDGNTYPLPEPFFVMATQNPITSIGTQFLPESQLDRFMIKLSMGYPSLEQEIKMLQNRHNSNPLDFVQPLLSAEQVVAMQQEVADIYVQDAIYKYIVYLSDATRKHEELQLGLSPRGTLALVAMAKACAYLNGRDYVIPEDVQNVFVDVASHRVVLEQKAKMSHRKEEEVLQQILKQVARPQIKRDEDAC